MRWTKAHVGYNEKRAYSSWYKQREPGYAHMHINPVKHGLVKRARDWPYSNFHRYEREGLYLPDWACEVDAEVRAGEPR